MLGFGAERVAKKQLSYTIELDSAEAIQNLLAMTPHMHKAPYLGREALSKLSSLTVTVDVAVQLFVKL